jgi:ATPase family associated with various cellular activities (AAA)/Winged helix domain, variant
MNDVLTWQEGNTRYLSAALQWIRACLEFCANQSQVPGHHLLAAEQAGTESQSFWRSFIRSKQAPGVTMPKLLPGPAHPSADPHVMQAAQAMQKAMEEMNPPPALLLLSRRLGLSEFEQYLLLLCLGIELDPCIAGLCARCQGEPVRAFPTFALAFSIFEKPSWDALSPERPLRYYRLLEISQPSGHALTVSPLRADERIINYLKGLNYIDDRLAPLLIPIEQHAGMTDRPASHNEAAETILQRLKQTETGKALPVVQLLGPDAASKQLLAGDVASSIGMHLYKLSSALLPSQAGDLEALARLWQRESLLLPLALYVDASETTVEGAGTGQGSPISRLLERTEGAVFLDTRDPWPGLTRPSISVDAAKPAPAEQESAWQAALGPGHEEHAALLAGHFNLSLTEIRRIWQQAATEAPSSPEELRDRLWKSCLASVRPRLDSLAHRLEPRMSWDDLVLPAPELGLLQQIAEQVAQRSTVYEKWGFSQKMSRGLGISALFAGDSGTGKTMAAEVIAAHLRLDLYRIDLSSVISKYIGETEKNLRRLFDAAENGGAILFFDEADALFGKRSEVKDSHDRYANIEINYLLQRMEAYRGLAILATNMKSALDPAFLRRLRFVVNFPFPGAAERKAIWQKVFPASVPTSGLDYDRLARLNVAGGNIYNIALNAAFMAARGARVVTMPLILEAARAEFRKLERPINEADFQWKVPGGGAVA